MKWVEISKERPPHGELIWVWNMRDQKPILIRYMGSEEIWLLLKHTPVYPVWAPLNEDEE